MRLRSARRGPPPRLGFAAFDLQAYTCLHPKPGERHCLIHVSLDMRTQHGQELHADQEGDASGPLTHTALEEAEIPFNDWKKREPKKGSQEGDLVKPLEDESR
ncbi:hypothetical protein MG293_004134 [Ovis ammon polii]|uniref:Uncharacterized protein n=1 Tax=Ovis ammon polii TaxID=230172 RepID=A0AAD4UPC3_OVIAM|nr:hypothetical protein MG293_004134 [Ovis ammon polii]